MLAGVRGVRPRRIGIAVGRAQQFLEVMHGAFAQRIQAAGT